MKLRDHLKWNPVVPLLLVVFIVIRGQARSFPAYAIVCAAVVTAWFVICLYRTLYRQSRRVSSFPPLSEADVVNRIGKARTDHFLASTFGFVWISDTITKYGYPIGMMFRDRSEDKMFSGWTFVSGHEDDWRFGSDVDVHDAQTILRYDPSVEKYLDLPPGVVLSRQKDGTFSEDA